MSSITEKGNTWTHLVGVVFALSSIWMVWPACRISWQMAMGVLFFIVGMFLMFLSSTIYHWLPEGRAKRILRKCDHISIYVMIVCSYTPLCIGVVGGWTGWTLFAILSKELQVPILPVRITGAFEAMPRGKHLPNRHPISVEYLPMIHPTQKESYQELSERVRESILN